MNCFDGGTEALGRKPQHLVIHRSPALDSVVHGTYPGHLQPMSNIGTLEVIPYLLYANKNLLNNDEI